MNSLVAAQAAPRTTAVVAESLLQLPYETWNFGDSVAFDAMLRAADTLGDPRFAAFAHGWARSWATRARPYRRLDCTAPGHAMVRMAVDFHDQVLLDALVGLADYLLTRPTIGGVFATWESSPLMKPYGPATLTEREVALLAHPPAGVFLDCLHFDPPFFTALGVATGNESYVSTGIAQAVGYVDLLQNRTGLFDHFVLDGVDGAFGPGWGRGQGWALLGLLDVLDALRAAGKTQAAGDKPGRETSVLSTATRDLITAMVQLQRPDGHWPAVVSVPGSGDEFSTAAFMATGMARAAAAGIVPLAEIASCVTRARAAVAAGIGPDGTLSSVSAAVMACTEPTHYQHVPRGFRVPWGQGPALLALTEATDG